MNKEIGGEEALRKLIEIKDIKIWDLNQELGRLTSELVNIRGAQGVVRELSAKNQDLKKEVKTLENSLANALAEDYKQKQTDEIIMIKMERINDLELINESHQKINGDLRREITMLEQEKLEIFMDNKKLAEQVEDQLERFRKAGM